MRIQITFSKTDAMRFTSHLDLQRAWERTLRRARLPLAYSQGFNPRPKINLADALPLGFTSEAELIEIWLEEQIPLAEIESALSPALPPGLIVQKILETVDPSPKIQNWIQSTRYRIRLENPPTDFASTLKDLLIQHTIIRERRGKAYDLRPLIENLHLEEDGSLHLQVKSLPGETGRPDEVLLALNIDPYQAHVCRTQFILQDPRE